MCNTFHHQRSQETGGEASGKAPYSLSSYQSKPQSMFPCIPSHLRLLVDSDLVLTLQEEVRGGDPISV